MIELNTRDLIVLWAISNWNQSQAMAVKHLSEAARVSAVAPCTVTKLCGKQEPDGGAVNRFIKDNGLKIELADDSEQIYRSTIRLKSAGLIVINERPKRYAQTKLGEELVNELKKVHPKNWPGLVKVDGKKIILPILLQV